MAGLARDRLSSLAYEKQRLSSIHLAVASSRGRQVSEAPQPTPKGNRFLVTSEFREGCSLTLRRNRTSPHFRLLLKDLGSRLLRTQRVPETRDVRILGHRPDRADRPAGRLAHLGPFLRNGPNLPLPMRSHRKRKWCTSRLALPPS